MKTSSLSSMSPSSPAGAASRRGRVRRGTPWAFLNPPSPWAFLTPPSPWVFLTPPSPSSPPRTLRYRQLPGSKLTVSPTVPELFTALSFHRPSWPSSMVRPDLKQDRTNYFHLWRLDGHDVVDATGNRQNGCDFETCYVHISLFTARWTATSRSVTSTETLVRSPHVVLGGATFARHPHCPKQAWRPYCCAASSAVCRRFGETRGRAHRRQMALAGCLLGVPVRNRSVVEIQGNRVHGKTVQSPRKEDCRGIWYRRPSRP